MPNAIALTAEYAPKRFRATAVTAMFCGFSIGAAAGGFVAAGLISRYGWQSVFIAGGVTPLLVAVLLMALLPESNRRSGGLATGAACWCPSSLPMDGLA